jgi:RNA polymerase sigma-70 factor (ECF subfamily)
LSEYDPDSELMARVGEKDPAAMRELVARKLPRLLALATRMLGDRSEAEDVAQDAFIRVWKSAGRWQPGAARLDTWLHRIVLNLTYDRLRRTRPETMENPPEQADTALAPDETISRNETSERLRQAMARLPVRQREALVLNYYQELSNVEAAATMDISVDALESLLSRARRNLRGMLASPPHSKELP